MYHRVAPAGADATVRYRVTPEAFERQLAYLREVGFHGVTLEEWVAALDARRPLGRRSVAFTFDDGYRDFATHAWPLLRRYGFGATVFLVADLIGRTNDWDRASGEEVPLLDWDEIARLHADGVRFGSHSATHPALTALPAAAVVREAASSRLALERGLGVPVTAFAYPYGDVDAAVQHLVGGAGYLIGVSCRAGSSGAGDAPLSLPRIEVTGLDGLEQFLLKLDA
jgi:peptidoglycan/xylan/chitin deacetylase (PgdA/CDA1 family)